MILYDKSNSMRAHCDVYIVEFDTSGCGSKGVATAVSTLAVTADYFKELSSTMPVI